MPNPEHAPDLPIVALRQNSPSTEFSERFLQGMLDRMAVSYYKYGPVAEGFPKRVDAIGTLRAKLLDYERTGNTEWLMDVANYAMIEFMHPRHPDAHFRPTDSKESKGRVWNGETDPLSLPNDITKHV